MRSPVIAGSALARWRLPVAALAPTRWRLPVVAVMLAIFSIGWLDPHERTREANRLFTAGKYDAAAAAYNEALVDHPDSPLLHFNLGDAAYKQGKYDDAINAFQQVDSQH